MKECVEAFTDTCGISQIGAKTAVMDIERNCTITWMHHLFLQDHFVPTAHFNQVLRKSPKRRARICNICTVYFLTWRYSMMQQNTKFQSRLIQACRAIEAKPKPKAFQLNKSNLVPRSKISCQILSDSECSKMVQNDVRVCNARVMSTNNEPEFIQSWSIMDIHVSWKVSLLFHIWIKVYHGELSTPHNVSETARTAPEK